MNKVLSNKIVLLFLCLAMAIVLHFLRIDVLHQRGLFWLGFNSDPSYGYLMNSLNMAFYNGGLGHQSLHPGIPMYMVGAVVIIGLYLFRYVSIGFDYSLIEGMQMDVLNNPEIYITGINAAFSIINIFLLFIITWLVYKHSKKLIYALLILFLPFYSEIFIQDVIGNVSAEPALFTANFLFLGYVLLSALKGWDEKYLYLATNPSAIGKAPKISYNALFMGLLCGFGLSAKLPFLAFWFIPVVLLYNFKEIIKFFFIAISTFAVCISPIIFRIFFTLKFWVDLSTRSAGYGHNFELGDAIKFILLSNSILFISLVVFSVIFFLILKYKQFKIKELLKSYDFRLALVFYLSFIIQIIIVSRHYMGSRYFLSCICLVPFLLISLLNLMDKSAIISDFKYTNYIKGIIYLLPFLFTINGFFSWQKMRTDLWDKQELGLEVHDFLKQNKEETIQVFNYRVSDPLYALRFGDEFARQLNQEKLTTIYKDFFHYNNSYKKYYNWDKEVKPQELLSFSKDILIFGAEPPEIIEQQFQKKVSLLKEFGNTKIYVIRNK